MFNLLRTTSRRVSLQFLGISMIALFALAGQAHAQCSSPANAIVAENCLPGNPGSEWDINKSDGGDPTIQGFATDISVNQGGTVFFKINTPATAYTINIYRMGYYGGMGARKVATISPSAHLPQSQPACATDTTVGLIDCGNWGVSASWQVPATATSGIYFAHLVRSDTGGDSHIVFIVRNDSSHSAVMYQTSDETWQAYNYYGAGSFYSQASPIFNLSGRSYKVSYNRPFLTRGFDQEWDTWVFGAEFAMVQWLEANGYDVTYFTGIDAARSGSLILNHKIYMDSGHDEYWSAPQRANVQAARDAGVNLAFFSGNTMFWKTRWENSIDGTNTANRTLVCYKETLAFAKIDPNASTWTGTWRDPSFSPPADGGKPENALVGTLFMVNGTGADNDGSLTIKVPSADGKMRFWRNTAAATLAPNATYTLPIATLGYEWDLDIDNGFRPAGAFQLSTSTYSLTSDLLLDYGATYGAGTATHHLMLYRAPSGALVFSSGTIDWSWGLNSYHDNLWSFQSPAPDPNMQQATVNLFADMGAQPATLQPGVVPATASSDVTPPVSTITFPTAGSTINTGNAVTVTGTASDTGGVVGGVELSTDGGTTWHPATGRSNWSYVWTPSVVTSSTTLLSRAVDDSANLEKPSNGVTVSVLPQTCPCSIWNSSHVPTNVDSGDGNAVEVGVKFRADSDGSIIGVRFYKAAKNTGSHIGHVWSSTGTLLGTANFASESSSGWQQVNFPTPISVVANTTYVISYYAPAGHYSADPYFFAQSGVDNPPLHALANGVDGQNGVYVYPPSSSTLGGFPNSGSLSTNYWVDVVYTSSNTYHISGTISGSGGAGAMLNLSGTETTTTTADALGNYSFNGVVNGSYTVTPSNPGVSFTPVSRSVTVNGGVVTGVNFTAVVTNPLSISGTISGGAGATVNLGGAATAKITADASGNYSFTGLLSGSYSVTPAETGFIFNPGTQTVVLTGSNATGVNFQGQICNCTSIWQPSATPVLIDSNDATPVEVGVKFRADSNGLITGLRFYKASKNVGTHVGHIWSSTGVQLGSATFTSESASGWQQVSFSTPIQVSANTTYVASYYSPSGHYSADTNYFATTGVDSPPLHALANGIDGPNGLYLYTSNQNGGFPSNTYASTNYWVDVVFQGAQAYSISGTISGAGNGGATVTLSSGSSNVTTTADASGNYTFNGVYAGSYSVTPTAAGVVFAPGNQNVTITGANVTGVNFAVPQICPCNTIWQPSTKPAVIDSGDGLPYELGVKFRADSDGYILGVRFYKAATNTGTHVGHLWSTTGTGNPLSSATFVNESGSGWQQVLFPNPVPVKANTTYIASYFAPSGHYSDNTQFFATAGVDSPPLHALANGVDGLNGVYSQSATSKFPSTSFNSGNYWVDAIYATTTTHSLGGVITGAGAAGATVVLSGVATATTTTDAYGNYGFSGLADGTYTATPNESGYVFSPGSQTLTISGAHNLSVNFASAPPTYVVSGTITGGPGITVSLTGTTIAPVTADASGNYNFPAVPNGSYTVTPSGVGFAISPANRNITVSGANVGAVNFTATAIAYSISGTVSGGSGATVNLNGAITASTTADASGNYSFAGITGGSYTITPAKPGLVFTPTSLTAAVAGANVVGANFTVPQNCPCDTIWQPSTTPAVVDVSDNGSIEVGVKFRSDSSGYILGIRFYKGAKNIGTHQGNLWSSTGTQLATATFTNEGSSGWQQVFFPTPVAIAANTTYIASYFAPAGQYSANSGFFTSAGVDSPPLHALANGVDGLDGLYMYGPSSQFPTNSFNAANYWVDVVYAPTYTISGTINGTGGAGATVSLSGAATATTTANASGVYTFSGLTSGSYTVTPSKTGYVFTPSNLAVTVSGANATANFSSAQTYTISGTIIGLGGNGTTVKLTGGATATVTANASGVYTFTVANGSYTVTPTKTGYVFTPTSQAVTVSGANKTANFISVVQIAIDITISQDQGTASTTVSTPAFSTTSPNELLLAFISADNAFSPNTTVTAVSGAGLTWALVERTNAQLGTAEIWRAFSPTPLHGVTATATLSQTVLSSITVMGFSGVNTSGANGSGAIGAIGTGNANPGAPTATLVTQGNGSLVIGVGTDWDNPIARTPGIGQSIVHQDLASVGDTYWVQMHNGTVPQSGTSVTLNDTAPAGDQYNLSIVEILALS